MTTNILMIVADDLNAWIGPLGRNPDVRTPNIDALAERASLFTHTYCPAPYCNASRMATFSGYLPSSTGVYGDEPFWEQAERPPTVMEVLADAGYYTFGAGKVFHGGFGYGRAHRRGTNVAAWNDKENRSEVWDDFVVNGPDHLPAGRPLNGLFGDAELNRTPRFNLFDWGPLPDGAEADMPDTVVAGAVAEFLRAPPRQPFFCAAGLYKPHLPWYVPQRYLDLYDPDRLTLPLVKADDLDDVPPIARQWALADPNHQFVTRNRQWRPALRAYLASITYCDARIGQILAALDASPARDNTVVVLFGDNGFHLGEKLHWRKFALWEEATRVPLLVLMPGDPKPRRVHEPVSLVDVFPTLLDVAGLIPDPRLDGQSLLPLVADPASVRATPAIMTWGRANHSVRSSRWRFTRYRDGTEELYDHAVDSYEWTNLVGRAAFDEVRRDLASCLPVDK